MKKVKKLLSLVLAVILAVTVFNVSDATLKVSAAGEHYLDPIIIPCNTNGFIDLHTTNYETYYAIDFPEDGDFKFTITSNNFHFSMYVPNRTYDIHWEKNVYTNSPFVSHFVVAAGRYYLKAQKSNANFRIKTEYTSFGFKDGYVDSFENPKNYSLGTEINDVVSCTDEADWYKLQINESVRYRLDYTLYDGSTTLHLYNNDMREMFYEWYKNGNYGIPDYKTVFLTPGTYYIKITGNYAKYKFNMYNYNIPTTKIKKVKSYKKRSAEVTFENDTYFDGYQIRYCDKKNFKRNVKTKTFGRNYYTTKYLNYRIGKLKSRKTYYFQIRTYVEKNNIRYYSDWSKTKKAKIK